MDIKEILTYYAKHPGIKALEKTIGAFGEHPQAVHLKGMAASSASVILSTVRNTPLVLHTLNDAEQAGYFYHDLSRLCGEERTLFFPSSFKRAIKYGRRDCANEILRTEVLARLDALSNSTANAAPLHIVTYPEALAEAVVRADVLTEHTIHLQVGQRITTSSVTESLISQGFQQVDYVYEPGQFAVRGSILDAYSYSSEDPFRIDFFGDEIDSLRTFEVESQLSRSSLQELTIVPSLTATPDQQCSLVSLLPPEAILAFTDMTWVTDRIRIIQDEGFTHQALVTQESEAEPQLLKPLLVDDVAITEEILSHHRIHIGPHADEEIHSTIDFHTTPQPLFHKNFDLLRESLSNYLAQGYKLHILADSPKQCERLKAILEENADDAPCEFEQIPFIPVEHTLHEGYADDTIHRVFFTDHQIFDRFHKYELHNSKVRNGKVALTLKELKQFQPGDFIVHIDHGVGRFGGLVRIPQGESFQEVIKIFYQGDDVVFVSIHSLHKISKYKGKEGEPPRLNKLGTGAWERIKEKTKSKIKDIARDLIRLYARRQEEKGFAFSPDSFLQHELEASFPYEDTPDQLKTTLDVKADMEREQPMDRLVCGDVGFGKTEIAIRAAFKAVADNKQVALLVPTTVLAYQHFNTFKARLKEFPCRIEYLSRARTSADTKRVLQGLKDGTVNIVIGTHRLVGKDVQFNDLGLLIIDEEQKFGVAVKEKLRKLKVNVDTLTLTATPIPRTLQFSLMGARDLSVIQTPPPNRHPIETELHTWDEEVFIDAINFEMSRGGQVFIVNNRIDSLSTLANMIERRIPDARICIGHGQMPPEKLENVILDFINFDYDVLIATTIIESGIDIPNVNTIIINNAQHFGLSDLHQLRGRVGRGNRKAFCYLVAPPLSALPMDACRRLQAIENFSDLGSGIHIAMQDLDIRGAGNMLGAEQSGFIADLGYETYQKILKEAVTELKNDEFSELYATEEVPAGQEIIDGEDFVAECTIESDLELLFPADYVPDSSERMLLYRELDSLELDSQVDEYISRLEDRFGKVPPEGMELIRIVALRRLGRRLGAEKIFLKAGRMTLFFVSNPDSPYYQSTAFGRIINYMAAHPRQCNLREQNGKRSMVIRDIATAETAVSTLQEVFA